MSKPIYLFSISAHPKVISINSLHVEFLKPNIDFSKYDYLIITSKQTSEALKHYPTQEYIEKPALCVSNQSALSFKDLGGKVLDIGGGYGDDLVDTIQEYPKETKWLYLRAKAVASDFANRCVSSGYSIDEAVVYESDCSKEILDVDVKDNSILIFTSPSSLNCFLKTHVINSSMKVIVIGKTTAKALPKGVECIISDKTTIESCMKLAFSL